MCVGCVCEECEWMSVWGGCVCEECEWMSVCGGGGVCVRRVSG